MIIYIEGVVGSGKTTLCEKVSSKLDIPIFYELQSQETLDLLEEFYKDKKRWAFTLQVHFLNERFKMVKKVQEVGKGILDRSLFGDKIFAEMLYQDGFMNSLEYNTYLSILDTMLKEVEAPKLVVYIDCDLETALERINGRNREMELSTPSTYWESLNKKYTDWYKSYNMSDTLSIGAKTYHPDNEEQIDNIVSQISNKL